MLFKERKEGESVDNSIVKKERKETKIREFYYCLIKKEKKEKKKE